MTSASNNAACRLPDTAFAMLLVSPSSPPRPLPIYQPRTSDCHLSTDLAALELYPHALAPVADLPVLEILSAVHWLRT